MNPLVTDVEMAERFGITVSDVRQKCLGEWPCVRPKRSVWRFTEEQVREIERIESRQPGSVAKKLPRPTARSQARRAS